MKGFFMGTINVEFEELVRLCTQLVGKFKLVYGKKFSSKDITASASSLKKIKYSLLNGLRLLSNMEM